METGLRERTRVGKALRIVFWAALGLFSALVLRRLLCSVESYRGIIEALDAKRATVFGLITASTAVSAAITVLPGDVGTPIASQIVELSEYFIVVLGALYLEKYLLTILGFLCSALLVPGACLLSILHELRPGSGWKRRLALTLLVVGIAGVLVVPASVAVSNAIDRSFHDSIQGSIDAVNEVSAELESEAEAQEDESLWNAITGAAQSVVSGVGESLEKGKAAVNHLIETITILLVTDCVIPVAVLLFFVWLSRQLVKAVYGHKNPDKED